MKLRTFFLLAGLCVLPVLRASAQVPNKAAVIERFSRDAQTFYDTARYDLADKRFAQILALDPGNQFALDGEQKTKIARQARSKTGSVEAGVRLRGDWSYPLSTWVEPAPRRGIDRDPRLASARPDSAEDRAVAELTRRLRSIVVPMIEFHGASTAEAIEFLRREASRLDPEHRGYSIFLKLPVAKAVDGSPAPEPKITLTATNLPLGEALRYVAAQVGLKVRIEPYAIAIVPISEQTDALVTAEFTVAPSLFEVEATGAPASTPTGVLEPVNFTARSALEAKGIIFPPGSSATYLPSSGKLVVRNTQENIDLIDKLPLAKPKVEPKKAGAQVRDKTAAVQQLLREARGLDEIARYAMAQKRYAQVLALDPDNQVARDGQAWSRISAQLMNLQSASEKEIGWHRDWSDRLSADEAGLILWQSFSGPWGSGPDAAGNKSERASIGQFPAGGR